MRLLLAGLGGIVATVALFVLMQWLIDADGADRVRTPPGAVVDFVRIQPEETIRRKQRVRPPPPPPPARPPPPPSMTVNDPDRPPPRHLEIAAPDIPVQLTAGTGPYIGAFEPGPAAEGDVVPIMRIAPLYPREARMRGTEGWVRVRFVITEDGSVTDARVVAAEPRRVFNREAVRAISRWRFKPRIVDGIAVRREAEQLIEFTLQEQ